MREAKEKIRFVEMTFSYILVVLILAASTDGLKRCIKHPTATCRTSRDCPNTYKCNKPTRICCRDKNYPEGCKTRIDESTNAPYKCRGGGSKRCEDFGDYVCIIDPSGKNLYSLCCEDCVCFDEGKMYRKYQGEWTKSDGCTKCTCECKNNPKCDSSKCRNKCGEFSQPSPCPTSSGEKTCGSKIQIRKCTNSEQDLQSQRNTELKIDNCPPQSPAQCPQPGVAKTEKAPIIFGGSVVNPPFNYRWMVIFFNKITEQVHCGGTVLSPNHILTAAHCFADSYQSQTSLSFIKRFIIVKTGKHDVTINEPHEQIKAIKSVSIHKGFDSLDNDIAIVTLNSPLQFNDYTHPINLPQTASFDSRTMKKLRKGLCKVVGWGAHNASNLAQMSDVLRNVEINLQRNCTLKALSDRERVTDNMFCASAINPNKTSGPIRLDSCFGDSGGPLMCRVEETWYQHGIVSWGPSFSCGEQSGVYTKVANYIDWIKDEISTPGGWGEFSGYSPCSATCGKGIKSRVKVCTNPEPIGNGVCPDYNFVTADGRMVYIEEEECSSSTACA